MPKHCTSLLVILAASMSFCFVPAIRRIGRCHALNSVGLVRTVGVKNHAARYRNGQYCGCFRKHDGRCRPFVGLRSSSTTSNDDDEDRGYLYKSVSAYLFRQGRTWRRLSHLLTMATDDKDEFDEARLSTKGRMKSVADVGTDHGLLAMGLAVSGDFNKVTGVDVSDQALTYGALALLGKIHNQTLGVEDVTDFPIEFRLGNGLQVLESGEADVICIAGMGVNTMLQILDDQQDILCTDLERIGCKRLVLQATNSRPRNLILLYDRLQELGWKVRDERIEKLSSRWYITTSFELINGDIHGELNPSFNVDLPGSKLVSLDKSSPMRKIFDEYCQHHKEWIEKDAKASSQNVIDPRDLRWLDYHAPARQ